MGDRRCCKKLKDEDSKVSSGFRVMIRQVGCGGGAASSRTLAGILKLLWRPFGSVDLTVCLGWDVLYLL